jgi:hypothetical protein
MQRWREGRTTPRGLVSYFPDFIHNEDESDDQDIVPLLGRCSDLRKHALADGLELADTAASLPLLDERLARWRADDEARPWLAIEVGLYLGTVLVHHHEGAVWETHDDDARPVIVLGDEYEVDVVDMAHDCVAGDWTLAEAYEDITRA